jgi:hypothetical protein
LLTTVARQRTDKHATNNSQYNNGSAFFGVRPRGYITRVFSEPGQLVFDSGAAAVSYQLVSDGKGRHKELVGAVFG